MAKTTAVKDEHGRHVFVGEGAVRQDGSLKLYRCNACGQDVVWATSKKTGKVYRVNVRRGYLDQRFYMKNDLHKCDGGESIQRAVAQADAHDAYMTAFKNLQARVKSGDIEKGSAEHLAAIDELDVLSDRCEELKKGAA